MHEPTCVMKYVHIHSTQPQKRVHTALAGDRSEDSYQERTTDTLSGPGQLYQGVQGRLD